MSVVPFRNFTTAPDNVAIEIACGSFRTPADLDKLVARLTPWAGVVARENDGDDPITLIANLTASVMLLQHQADKRAAITSKGETL